MRIRNRKYNQKRRRKNKRNRIAFDYRNCHIRVKKVLNFIKKRNRELHKRSQKSISKGIKENVSFYSSTYKLLCSNYKRSSFTKRVIFSIWILGRYYRFMEVFKWKTHNNLTRQSKSSL